METPNAHLRPDQYASLVIRKAHSGVLNHRDASPQLHPKRQNSVRCPITAPQWHEQRVHHRRLPGGSGKKAQSVVDTPAHFPLFISTLFCAFFRHHSFEILGRVILAARWFALFVQSTARHPGAAPESSVALARPRPQV
jgi:hypothetical protein